MFPQRTELSSTDQVYLVWGKKFKFIGGKLNKISEPLSNYLQMIQKYKKVKKNIYLN